MWGMDSAAAAVPKWGLDVVELEMVGWTLRDEGRGGE